MHGTPALDAPLTRFDEAAASLGTFLRSLHTRAPSDAPHNPGRGVALAQREAAFEQRVSQLRDTIDADATRNVWRAALEAPRWSDPPVWLHGDLHAANVLTQRGDLIAVIDFGDMCSGDPATDLAGAWMLLLASSMNTFTSAYGGVDEELERRALGWAVLFALMHLEIGLEGRRNYEDFARSALSSVIARTREAH
jgi:aminoglycoside phosphotransferase (APT) family kinase protein